MKTAPARHSCLSFMLMLTEFVYLFIFMKPTVSLFFIFIFRRDHRPRRICRPPPGHRRKRYECRGIAPRATAAGRRREIIFLRSLFRSSSRA